MVWAGPGGDDVRAGLPGPGRGAAGGHGVVRPGPVRQRCERGEPAVRAVRGRVGGGHGALAVGPDGARRCCCCRRSSSTAVPLTEVATGRTVTDVMRGQLRSRDFLGAFVKEATAVKPPTGFVRDFVVDHRGHHRGQLDLKRGGLLPVAAIGRWVAVVTGDTRGGTLDRLRRGHQAGLLTGDEADTLAAAFGQVYELLLTRDLAAVSAGVAPHDVRRPARAGHPDPAAPARDVPRRGHDPGGRRRRVVTAHPPMSAGVRRAPARAAARACRGATSSTSSSTSRPPASTCGVTW